MSFFLVVLRNHSILGKVLEVSLVRDHPYITSEKGLGGRVKKMTSFVDAQYCICADNLGGWIRKVQNYADVIYGWSLIAYGLL